MNLWRRVPTRPLAPPPPVLRGGGWSSSPGTQYGPGATWPTPVHPDPVAPTLSRPSTHVLLFFLTSDKKTEAQKKQTRNDGRRDVAVKNLMVWT